MTEAFTVPLNTRNNDLEVVGGKGRSLSRLANAGYNVPGGFQIPISAYRGFVTDNQLQDRILELSIPTVHEGAISFEQASVNIAQLFAEHEQQADKLAAISKVPIADWVALLEDGWGAIKETRFGMAYGDKKLYIPYRILSP